MNLTDLFIQNALLNIVTAVKRMTTQSEECDYGMALPRIVEAYAIYRTLYLTPKGVLAI